MPEYDFNPPPGWPAPPARWRPTPGWQPDPRWPAPPAGWPFWIERRPPRWRKPLFTVIGIAAAVAIVAVIGTTFIRSTTSDRGITVPADADVPEFSTVDEALAYYENEKSTAYEYVTIHPWGYDYGYLDTRVGELDDAVDAEQHDLFPDPNLIARAGYSITVIVTGYTRRVAEWEATYGPKPELLANASGTPAEAALDTISAGVADISFDDFCGTTDDALACVSSGNVVHVPAEITHYTDAQMRDEFGDHWASVMVHEFAHVVQNKYGIRLRDDRDYRRLFVEPSAPAEVGDDVDYPAEHSADCMAAAIQDDYIMGYPGDCTPEKLDFARTIWDGTFYSG